MVPYHDDERALAQPEAAELVEHASDQRIVEGDLTVVGGVLEGLVEWGRRRVRRVRIVEVEPREPRRRAIAGPRVEPGRERGHRVVPAALGFDVDDVGPGRGVHPVVVSLEAAGEAVAPVEDERAHERGGAIACPAERCGKRIEPSGQIEVAVAARAVLERVERGEQRGVRRKCDGRRAGRLREARPLGREAVERRRPGAGVTVAADVVRARGVQGNEQDVRPRIVGRGRARGGPSQGDDEDRDHGDGDADEDEGPPPMTPANEGSGRWRQRV
jgi:hypothetical protein